MLTAPVEADNLFASRQNAYEKLLPGVPDAIRLPKCETAEYVLQVDKRLDV